MADWTRAARRFSFFSAVCVLAAGCAQRPVDRAFTLKQVGPRAWAAINNPHASAPADANAGFIIGDNAVVVIDTCGSTSAANQLLAEIRQRTSLPITVVDTHYHIDHVAGNGVFARAGAVILAQRNVSRWIRSENLRLLGDHIPPALKALVDGLVPPMVEYERGVDLHVGAHDIQVRSLPGHTGGDSIVMIPDLKLAFTGDLLWRNMMPTLVDASTRPWIDTLDTVLANTDAGYTFVPGHGEIATQHDVSAFKDYLVTLRELVAKGQDAGKSGAAIADAAVPMLRERYGHWEFFDPIATQNLLEVDAELRGNKRVPEAERGQTEDTDGGGGGHGVTGTRSSGETETRRGFHSS